MTFVIGTPYTHNAGYSWTRYSCDTKVVEVDIQTCPHCQAVIKMQEWARVEDGKMGGGYCSKCQKPVCGLCNKQMAIEGCTPFLAKLEREVDMTYKLQQILKDAGMLPEPPRPLFTGIITGE